MPRYGVCRKCEHCVNNPVDLMCMFWILIHAKSLIWSEQGKRFINGSNLMLAECSQFPVELEKLVPVAWYSSLLYSIFSCEVLFHLNLWACFLSGMLIETFFMNKICIHGGCVPTKATGNFKQRSQESNSCPGLKCHLVGTDCCACKAAVLGNLLLA